MVRTKQHRNNSYSRFSFNGMDSKEKGSLVGKLSYSSLAVRSCVNHIDTLSALTSGRFSILWERRCDKRYAAESANAQT